MPTGIDHIVIAVRDLAQTTTDYQRAGFSVIQGGEHKGGATHNALVAFTDGVYFELIAFKNPDAEQDHKWWDRLSAGEGLIDYALRTNDLAQEAIDLRARGLDASEPIDGGRFRPDGERLDWQTLRFEGASSSALPFYCFDLTERNLRVPHGDDAIHANGVQGVAGLTVVVADINASAPQFAALTGVAGETVTNEYEDAAEARQFALGNAWITIVQPTEQPSDLRQQLAVRGDSIYSVSLIAPAGGDASVPIELVHGARLLLPGGSQSSDTQSSESLVSQA